MIYTKSLNVNKANLNKILIRIHLKWYNVYTSIYFFSFLLNPKQIKGLINNGDKKTKKKAIVFVRVQIV